MSRLRASVLVTLEPQHGGGWYASAPWLESGIIRDTWEEALDAAIQERPR